jgi:hypothetical protein
VVYYSNNRLPAKLQRFCLDSMAQTIALCGLPVELICVTWQPLHCPHILWPHHTSTHRNLYQQILAGIAAAQGGLIALAEHDVLYPVGYFESLAAAGPAGIVYNTNVWRMNRYGFFRSTNPHLLSNCGAPKTTLRRRIQQKLAEAQRAAPEWAEPPADAEFCAPHATVDIRHSQNFTGDRRAPHGRYRKTIPYWGAHTRYTGLLHGTSGSQS